MEKRYEKRHMFLVIAICIVVVSSLSLLIVPQIVAELIHFNPGNWYVFVPVNTFIIYGAGFLFLFLSAILLYFLGVRKLSIVLSIACLLLSIIPFYAASQSYKVLRDEVIVYSSLFSMEENLYSWEEIATVNYYEGEGGDFGEYEILFQDDNSIKLIENGHFRNISYHFLAMLADIGVTVD